MTKLAVIVVAPEGNGIGPSSSGENNPFAGYVPSAGCVPSAIARPPDESG